MKLHYYTDGKRHLVCLPYSKENLHEMAKRLDINKCWFHRDHYDIPLRRREEIEAQCRMVHTRIIMDIIQGVRV